jgi:hypothetical protein
MSRPTDQQLERALTQRAALDQKIKGLQKKINARHKRDETRRKILIAEWLLGQRNLEQIAREMDAAGALARPRDRALFDLPPERSKPASNATEANG